MKIAITLLFIMAILVSFMEEQSNGATLQLSFTAPDRNARADTCAYEDTLSTCTDLKEVIVRGWRFGDTDTLDMGVLPLVGAEGDSIAFDLDIDPGTMGVILLQTKDITGNVGCTYASYLFAMPAVDSVVSVQLSPHYELVWKKSQ